MHHSLHIWGKYCVIPPTDASLVTKVQWLALNTSIKNLINLTDSKMYIFSYLIIYNVSSNVSQNFWCT